jgi:hypothetical protein
LDFVSVLFTQGTSLTKFAFIKNNPMSKFLPGSIWFVILLSSCAQSSRNAASSNNNSNSVHSRTNVNQDLAVIDTTINQLDSLLAEKKPQSLMELPKSQDGGFVLSPGYYEADFRSYCLQPGTPDPSARDAYLQAPLTGYRKDIVASILRNSQEKTYLEQKNIQLLLWSVVSGSNFNKLSPSVKSTANQLLSPKQVFELKGGVMGTVKTMSAAFPSRNNNLTKLFEMGTGSYEAFERIAVLRKPSEIRRPDLKRDQWYKQEDGYYVRYLPASYQRVSIQVYVPEGIADTTAGKFIIFDPVSMLAIPANSNAQRLGIGAPVIEIVRAIIKVQKRPGDVKKLPPPNRTGKAGTMR